MGKTILLDLKTSVTVKPIDPQNRPYYRIAITICNHYLNAFPRTQPHTYIRKIYKKDFETLMRVMNNSMPLKKDGLFVWGPLAFIKDPVFWAQPWGVIVEQYPNPT